MSCKVFVVLYIVLEYFALIQFQDVANCDIYILLVVTERQGDKSKDYMSLEVVPEDEPKETGVMEEDGQTKVNNFNPVSIKFCTFLCISEVTGV